MAKYNCLDSSKTQMNNILFRKMRLNLKAISPAWFWQQPRNVMQNEKALVGLVPSQTKLLYQQAAYYLVVAFFLFFLCPWRLGRLAICLKRRLEALLFWGFSHLRAMVFGMCREEAVTVWKGKGAGSQKKKGVLAKSYKRPRKISVCRPGGTNLLWHNRTVHKQGPWEVSGQALTEWRGWEWENKSSQSFIGHSGNGDEGRPVDIILYIQSLVYSFDNMFIYNTTQWIWGAWW